MELNRANHKNMDTIIKKNRKANWKTLAAAITLCALGLLTFQFMGQKKQASINKDQLTIKKVELDYFEDMALFTGRVEPLNSVLINTLESGTVSGIFVEDGQMVKKGQALMELNNPNTELNYLTQEAIIIEQINNLRNSSIALKNAQFNIEKDLIEIEHNFSTAERQYKLDTSLYASDLISQNDLLSSQGSFEFLEKQHSIVKKSVNKEKIDRASQLSRINKSIKKMEMGLNKIQANRENFIVKAGASGKLSSFKPTIGENYNSGEPIAKIDLLDGYKLITPADEFYISRVSEGQVAELNFGGKKYEMILVKILPEVVDGKFNMEFKFQTEMPENIQRGMNFSIKLYFSDKEKKSLLLPKGGYYQSSGGRFVFVLVNENQAEKRAISFGKSNPYFFEITDGLKENDQVITSSYENYLTMEMLNLK